MAKYPEIQRKAQEELEAYVGPNRLPDFSDYGNLVYCRAIVKETFRWRPVIPYGVIHRVMCDDEYEGLFIPKGATVVFVSAFALLSSLLFDEHITLHHRTPGISLLSYCSEYTLNRLQGDVTQPGGLPTTRRILPR